MSSTEPFIRRLTQTPLHYTRHVCSVSGMRDGHSFMAARKKTVVIIAFAALYVIWGSTYLGIRFAIETIPPFLMAGARFLLAGAIMYAIAGSQGSLLRRSGSEGWIGKASWANWRTSLIIGACLLLG